MISAGQRYKRLSTIRPASGDSWLCRCDCSKEVVASQSDLLGGMRSCGCMVLMSFDVATQVGWAVWPLDRSESAIETGIIDCSVKGSSEMKKDVVRLAKRDALLSQLPDLFRKFWPDYVVIEQPLNNVKRYAKKPGKNDLLARSGQEDAASKAEMGMDPNSAFTAQQMFAVVDSIAHAYVRKNRREVHPQTWQPILKAWRYAGDTKAQSIEGCRVLGIGLPAQKKYQADAADAAMIAVWARGHIQQLKLAELSRRAA